MKTLNIESTKGSKTLYNSVKPKLATFVSTTVLSFILGYSTPVLAGSTSSVQTDEVQFAKLCFTLSNAVYDMVQRPEQKAVYLKDSFVLSVDKGLGESFEDLFYLAMAKKEIYKNQNLKAYLRLHCTGIVRKAMDKGYAEYLAE